MKTLIVIPAFNEEACIREMVCELRETAPWADILVIDDCSTDQTLPRCRMAGIPVLTLPVNLGIGGVVQTGYLYALQNDYEIAVQMDGDGQHHPGMLDALLAPIRENCADMTIGSRFLEQAGPESGVMAGAGANAEAFKSTRLRRVGIRFFEHLIRFLSGKRITDATSGFRACNRKAMALFVLDYARDYPEPEAVMTALQNRLRVLEVPVDMRERQGGISSIRHLKTLYYMLKVSLAILISTIKPQQERIGVHAVVSSKASSFSEGFSSRGGAP